MIYQSLEVLGDRSLRMGREKKPYEEYPATESRMVQTRYEPDEETYS